MLRNDNFKTSWNVCCEWLSDTTTPNFSSKAVKLIFSYKCASSCWSAGCCSGRKSCMWKDKYNIPIFFSSNNTVVFCGTWSVCQVVVEVFWPICLSICCLSSVYWCMVLHNFIKLPPQHLNGVKVWILTWPLWFLIAFLLYPFCCRSSAEFGIIVLLDPLWPNIQLLNKWTHVFLQKPLVCSWSTQRLQEAQTISLPPPCMICCACFHQNLYNALWINRSKLVTSVQKQLFQ